MERPIRGEASLGFSAGLVGTERRREVSCEPLENATCRGAVAVTDPVERFGDGGLDRTTPDVVDAMPTSGQPEDRSAPIRRVLHPQQQPLRDQPLQHAGERAGMHVKDRSQVPRRESGEETDDPKDEALRPSDPEVGRHPLGCLLHPVNDGPQQLHELQDVWQLVVGGRVGVRNWGLHSISLRAN